MLSKNRYVLETLLPVFKKKIAAARILEMKENVTSVNVPVCSKCVRLGWDQTLLKQVKFSYTKLGE